VSGYLYSEDSEHLASHAWAEAWIDNAWYSFDVTNQLAIPERHLKLAVGLDYLDACPVRGMRRGGGCEQMHAKVLVSPAATPTAKPAAEPAEKAPVAAPMMQVQRQG
jgi:transglutaminase-like putative cysteine protease